MNCEKCGFENDKGANFCKQCGNSLEIVEVAKGKAAFVAGTQRDQQSDFLCFGEEERSSSGGGMIFGIIFICIAVIMAVAMFTNLFTDFGSGVGDFFGNFGENMGKIGEDIGEFFSNWGSNFGTSVENFFGGTAWWDILQYVIVLLFLVIGIILVVRGYQKNR
ncbi:MAG: hypothetical protein ACXAB2_12570 [Candidatus Hodarchaeales archaeon]|jgi:hypothetical protein